MTRTARAFIYCLLTCFLCFNAMAAEDFDDGWSAYTDSGTWITDPAGTTLYASIQDDNAWGSFSKSFQGATGAVATFNVSSATGLGADAGMRKNVAILPSGYLLAEIWVEMYNGNYTAMYRVRERDPSTSATIRTIARGYLGNSSGSNWSIGQDVTLGFGVVEGMIGFYCSSVPDTMAMVMMPTPYLLMKSSSIQVTGWAGGDGSMDFTVSNMNIVYTQADLFQYTGLTSSYEVFIPHLTGGFSDWKDYLQVDNDSPVSASFTLVLYDSTGIEVYNAPHTVSALARSKTFTDIKALAGAGDAQCGYISYTDPGLTFRLSYESLDGGGVAEFKLTDDLNPDLGFYFSDFTADAASKGIAFANMTNQAGSVTLSAIGGGGVLGTTTIPIAAHQKIMGGYQTWFATIPFADLDAIVASSTVEICGIVISGNGDNSKLLFTTGVPLE